jgi:phage tail sheath protein FI
VPEYLAPGVFVEETSFRAKSIEGVSTSTTGFAGPTLTGPHGGTPELITSFADFERLYGGLDDLDYGANSPATNYLAHAVRAYFNEGGSRLYVARVLPQGAQPATATTNSNAVSFAARFKGKVGNGTITLVPVLTPATVAGLDTAQEGSVIIGRASPAVLPGDAGPFDLSAHTELELEQGANLDPLSILLDEDAAEVTADSALTLPSDPTTLKIVLNGVQQPDVVLAAHAQAQDLLDAINGQLQGAYARIDSNALVIGALVPPGGGRVSVVVKKNEDLGFDDTAGAATVEDISAVTIAELDHALRGAGIRALEIGGKLALQTTETGTNAKLHWPGAGAHPLGFDTDPVTGSSTARTYVKGASGWVDANGAAPANLPSIKSEQIGDFLTLSIRTRDATGREASYDGVGLDPLHPRWIGNVLSEEPTRRAEALTRLYAIRFTGNPPNGLTLYSQLSLGQTQSFTLAGGSDGSAPSTSNYEDALDALGGVDDISIIAAPGSSAYDATTARGVRNALISAAERRRAYRVAVLDTPPDQEISGARDWRSEIDSKYAALYYPWVVVPNPLARPGDERIARELTLPPSGFLCGIYARNDVERGVFKAPANEVVRSALRFETDVNFAQQEVLNPLGVNCLRSFPGRGYRVWGARTASSDPEWKYVNVRRYFAFLERSIDVGTQWAVFEPNGERLWANIRETIGSFLETQWRSGALLGSDPKQAYFVRCDRSTMTQDDLDNGRLVCLVGVAVVKPAEFVIFRIGQKTADARS